MLKQKISRIGLAIIASIAILVIILLSCTYFIQKRAITEPLHTVQQEIKNAQVEFGPALTALGIKGQPQITSGCSDSTGTWLFETEKVCSSSLEYPSNFNETLSTEQLAQYPTNANKLDTLFLEHGWKAGMGPQTFDSLKPTQYDSKRVIETKNADYFKKVGINNQCSIVISLDSPQNTELTTGAVLNLVSFDCSKSVTYLHLNL